MLPYSQEWNIKKNVVFDLTWSHEIWLVDASSLSGCKGGIIADTLTFKSVFAWSEIFRD
jgi:hypothetical protein